MFFAIVIGILFVVSFFLPKEATINRSTVIKSSSAQVFDYLNKAKNFNEWSPWFELEPEGKYEFSGPEIGVGGKLSWEGEKTGKGTQEIIESNPYQNIQLKLIFDGQPPAYAAYELAPVDDGTKVTWSFKVDLNGPIDKYMGLMIDSFVGDMYEAGLKNLKAKVESLPKQAEQAMQENSIVQKPEVVTVDAQALLYVSNKVDFDADKISQAMAQDYAKLVGFMAEKQLNFAGPPLAITIGGSPEEGFWAFEAAMPIDIPAEVDDSSEIKFKQSYSGKAVKLVHIGSYMSMSSSYEKLAKYVMDNGLEMNGNVWEQYISDPGVTAEKDLITHLYFPVK